MRRSSPRLTILAALLVAVVVGLGVVTRLAAPTSEPARELRPETRPRSAARLAQRAVISPGPDRAVVPAATRDRVESFVRDYLGAVTAGDQTGLEELIDADSLFREAISQLVERLPAGDHHPPEVNQETLRDFERSTVALVLAMPEDERNAWGRAAAARRIEDLGDGRIRLELHGTIPRQAPAGREYDGSSRQAEIGQRVPTYVSQEMILAEHGGRLRVVSWGSRGPTQ